MKKSIVTSIDVARRAGVSQSAVSRTFSKGPTQSSVAAKTRAKVMQAAAELGYRPNAIARSLITQKSMIVGLLFSYLDNPFYALALEKFCLSLQQKGYHAMVFMMPDTVQDAEQTVSDMLEYQVDGIITASVELSSRLCEYCASQNIPVVMFNRTQDEPHMSSVTTDNVDGGRLAARHLLDGGYQRIALLAGWEGASTNRDRELGFISELEAHGAALFDRAVGHFDLGKTAEATRALFSPAKADHPDAVFVTSDHMAIAAMDVLRFKLGLRIPEDVAVIGFDDIPMAAMPAYDLTTIRQPITRMVDETVRTLFESIDRGPDALRRVCLEGQLVQRTSTRIPG